MKIITILAIFCGDKMLDLIDNQTYFYQGCKFSGIVWVRGAVDSRLPPKTFTPHLIIPLQNPYYRGLYINNQVTFHSN